MNNLNTRTVITVILLMVKKMAITLINKHSICYTICYMCATFFQTAYVVTETESVSFHVRRSHCGIVIGSFKTNSPRVTSELAFLITASRRSIKTPRYRFVVIKVTILDENGSLVKVDASDSNSSKNTNRLEQLFLFQFLSIF